MMDDIQEKVSSAYRIANQGDFDHARMILEEVLYDDSNHVEAWLLLADGDAIEAISWGQKVLALDPCWEDAYRLLMRAHMANGNRPTAVRAYQQCVQALGEELGIEPMEETIALYEQVQRGEIEIK